MAHHLPLPVDPRQLMQLPVRSADVRECPGVGDGERAGASPITGLNALGDRECTSGHAPPTEGEWDRLHRAIVADVDRVTRRNVSAIRALARDGRALAAR